MKINKFNQLNESAEDDREYYKELGHDKSISDYLSEAYGLWCDAEGLEQLSADDHDRKKLTKEQLKFIDAFITIWDITSEFESEYFKIDEFMAKRTSKKYNL